MKEGIKKCAGELTSTFRSIKLAATGAGMVKVNGTKLKNNMICGLDSDCESTHYCGKRHALVTVREGESKRLLLCSDTCTDHS